ncbi:MAG: hypothetical protein [Caudoviricetes sp.]|nr:MAG: hypothetical protein [Caudoviricetes sp.]
MPVIAYSMLNVQATLDGQKVTGLGDGDNAIEVAWGSDVGTPLVGADGTYLFSQSADQSATITIRVKPNSPTHRQLTQKLAAQRAGRLTGFTFDVVDSGMNEGGTAVDCFIKTAPTDQKGTNAVVREWGIWSGNWTPLIPNP